MNVLRSKVDEELKTHNFGKSDGVCGVVHVLNLKSRTAAVLKVGYSSYPKLFDKHGTLKRYKNVFAPMALEQVEAIHIYQSPRRAQQVEEELHRQLRGKFGNVNPHKVKSRELYKVEHLEAILGLLHEIEQKPSEPSCQEMTSRQTKKANENILKRIPRE